MSLGPFYVAEPPVVYRQPPLVVDCSILVAIHFNEALAADASRCLHGRNLHAPALLSHEMANIALVKHRRGEPLASARQALLRYGDQAIQLHDTDPAGQFELGLRYGLSAYDAAYLWLAAELRAPLATFDAKLAQAAREHLGQLS